MTGFVFTFSLLCTAVLQGDPSALQYVEAGTIRHILDTAVPAMRFAAMPGRQMESRHPACIRVSGAKTGFDGLQRLTIVLVNDGMQRSGRLPAAPIRGPAGCA